MPFSRKDRLGYIAHRAPKTIVGVVNWKWMEECLSFLKKSLNDFTNCVYIYLSFSSGNIVPFYIEYVQENVGVDPLAICLRV